MDKPINRFVANGYAFEGCENGVSIRPVTKEDGKMFDNLKPCPFCGSEAVLFVDEGIRVLCPKCRAASKTMLDNMIDGCRPTNATKKVIEAWNRRVDDGQQ